MSANFLLTFAGMGIMIAIREHRPCMEPVPDVIQYIKE